MKTIRYAVLAATLGAVGLSAMPAEARPHHPRQKVCTVKWVHHHKVRRCYWR